MIKIDKEIEGYLRGLSDNEFERLKEDIKENGIRDPLVIWKDENILIDGHHRYKIAQQLNIEFKTKEIEFNNKYDVLLWVINNQLGKRNLTPIEKDYFIGKEYEVNKKKVSNEKGLNQYTKDEVGGQNVLQPKTAEKIAEKHNVSDRTVKRAGQLSKSIDEIAKNTGEDVKTFIGGGKDESIDISKKDIVEIAKLKPEKQKDIIDKVKKEDKKDTKKIIKEEIIKEKRAEREAKKEELKELSKTVPEDDKIKIINADFREYSKILENESIDCIITDPPYPKEFLHLYDDLGKVAYRLLKPSGFLIVYCGHIYLNEIFRMLDDSGMLYYWIYSYINSPNKRPTAIKRNCMCGWKPILIYQKPPLKESPFRFIDMIDYDILEKDLHEWQQGEKAYFHFLDKFTYPNDLIYEPFAGGGTVPACCKKMNRRCIANEINKDMVDVIKGRLAKIDSEKEEDLF